MGLHPGKDLFAEALDVVQEFLRLFGCHFFRSVVREAISFSPTPIEEPRAIARLGPDEFKSLENRLMMALATGAIAGTAADRRAEGQRRPVRVDVSAPATPVDLLGELQLLASHLKEIGQVLGGCRLLPETTLFQ